MVNAEKLRMGVRNFEEEGSRFITQRIVCGGMYHAYTGKKKKNDEADVCIWHTMSHRKYKETPKSMLYDELLRDRINYPHLTALIQREGRLIVNEDNCFILYSEACDVHAAEIRYADHVSMMVNNLKNLNVIRLETCSKQLYNALSPEYKHAYACYQYTFENAITRPFELERLHAEDLSYVINTYGEDGYIRALFDNGLLFGYYKEGCLIGYVAKHIDGTLGCMFIKPSYRNKGHGSVMTAQVLSYDLFKPAYSQVLTDNAASIQLHKKLNATLAEKEIYWLYNNGFIFKDRYR